MMKMSELGEFWIAELIAELKERRESTADNMAQIKADDIYAAQHKAYIDTVDRMLAAAPAAPVAAPAPSEQDKIDAERYRWIRDHADVTFDAAVWFTTDSGMRINVTSCSPDELDRAVDSGRGAA